MKVIKEIKQYLSTIATRDRIRSATQGASRIAHCALSIEHRASFEKVLSAVAILEGAKAVIHLTLRNLVDAPLAVSMRMILIFVAQVFLHQLPWETVFVRNGRIFGEEENEESEEDENAEDDHDDDDQSHYRG